MSNEHIAAITDAIIEAANVAIPRGRPNGRRRTYKPLPYWSDDCKMRSQTETQLKANTTLRLDQEQAVIKNVTRLRR